MTHKEWIESMRMQYNPYYNYLEDVTWDIVKVRCMYKAYLCDDFEKDVLMKLIFRELKKIS